MRWAIVKSSLSTIRATVGSCACGEMTASSSDASRTCVVLGPTPRTRRLGALPVLCPARESRLCGSCSARVLVSAKWREQLLSKLWRRMAGEIRLRHPNRCSPSTGIAARSASPYLSEYDVRYSQRVRLGYSDAKRADKALQGQAANIPTTLLSLSL
jgi:hypothetical protein